jgi:hypothetical protein
MPNYKVVVHRNKVGTKPLKTLNNVPATQLAQIVYGLTTDFPGCCLSFYPVQNQIIIKNASIRKQLEKFLNK